MHPLMVEEFVAERIRALHEQAHRTRPAGRGRAARRMGVWLIRAGVRLAERPGELVHVEVGNGGPRGA